jgi:hypothetical protein
MSNSLEELHAIETVSEMEELDAKIESQRQRIDQLISENNSIRSNIQFINWMALTCFVYLENSSSAESESQDNAIYKSNDANAEQLRIKIAIQSELIKQVEFEKAELRSQKMDIENTRVHLKHRQHGKEKCIIATKGTRANAVAALGEKAVKDKERYFEIFRKVEEILANLPLNPGGT